MRFPSCAHSSRRFAASANTSQVIFDVPTVTAAISEFVPLVRGDERPAG